MKKSTYVKIILVMLVAFVMFTTKTSFAANTNNYVNLTDTINENKTTNNTTTNNTTNNTTNTATNNTTNNTVLKTNNTSNYNNSSLPHTGIEDSVPTVILVVVLGISAIYAYKKVQYYKNI